MRPVRPDDLQSVPRATSAGRDSIPTSGARLVSGARGPRQEALRGGPAGGSASEPSAAPARALAESLGLRATPASLSALSALAGERLPLGRQAVLILLRVMARHGDDPAAARVAARALAAGLDTTSPALEAILSFLAEPEALGLPSGAETLSGRPSRRPSETGERENGGGGDGASRDDRGDGGPGDDGASQGDRGGAEHGDRGGAEHGGGDRRGGRAGLDPGASPGEQQEGLPAGRLKAMAIDALRDEAYRGLQRPASDGSGWACVPFSLTIEGMALHGFFRICYDSTRRVERFVADIRSGGRRRLLDLSGTGSALALRYGADDEDELASFEALFSREARVTCLPVGGAYAVEIERRRSVDEDA